MANVLKPNFAIELSLLDKFPIIAGVDEVGRGAIAGPIVAAAVVFSDYRKIIRKLKGVNDSKKLTAKQRKELSEIIKDIAESYAIGQVSATKIDLIGIGAANILAFKRALDQLPRVNHVIIDGRNFHGFDYPYSCYVRGESLSISIAAASILAKEYRDNLMKKFAKEYCLYAFDSNVGYGGRGHYIALELHGPCSIHRQSFLKKFNQNTQQTSLF